MKRIVLFLLPTALLFSACGVQEGIEISDVWARAAAQGTNSAIYFVIQNHNTEADELIGVASSVADAVEVHESKVEGDVMKMTRMESVTLESSQKVVFKPGGYHVMLIGLKQELKAGDEIEIKLQFKNSADITVKATVKAPDGMNNMEH